MIKHLIPLAFLATAATPLAASTLAGVSDEETVIRSGKVEEFQQGKGDVVFLRDRENKWYRVALNAGCLEGAHDIETMLFDTSDTSAQIDRHTRVKLTDGLPRTCAIESIRRSEAPPQVNSKSPVTLD